MEFFEEGGWWLPDGEEHLQWWMNKVNRRERERLSYQFQKYEAALKFVPKERRRTAIDIGAHVGLWSYHLLFDFECLHAFEPMPAHRDCWHRNVGRYMTNREFHLHPFALGEKFDFVGLKTRTPNSSGDTGVVSAGEAMAKDDCVLAEMIPLDSLNIPAVDFVKIDCEGYELFVVKGAKRTLKEWKPVVIVEQKPQTGMGEKYGVGQREAVEFLKLLGAKQRLEISGDFIMSWD